jgi:rare lipoprotein A
MRLLRIIFVLGLMSALAACASTPKPPPSSGGTYRVGKPYKVRGVWYYPHVQPHYNKVGIASWYGPGFHGRLTADGEIFNQNAITAAHTTLPLPVNVRVTNLDNGRSLVVRVNDRGPFVNGRIIDLSKRAAELLGFKRKGTARVRVQYIGRANTGSVPYMMEAHAKPPQRPSASKIAASVPQPIEATASLQPPSSSALPPPLPQPAPRVALAAADQSPPRATASATVSDAGGPAAGSAAPDLGDVISASEAAIAEAKARMRTTAATGSSSSPPPYVTDAVATVPPAASSTAQIPAGAGMKTAYLAGRVYVQAGAFSNANNAYALYKDVIGLGKVSISPATTDGVTVYRVRLGPIRDASEALRLTAKLRARGHDAAQVVVQ